MDEATDAEDPFVVVTSVYALVARGTAGKLDSATFLDAFGVLDEVSVGGFATYLAETAAGRRWREAVKALHTIGVPAHATLLERAQAAHAAGADLQTLDGEHQDGRTDLATALANWIKR